MFEMISVVLKCPEKLGVIFSPWTEFEFSESIDQFGTKIMSQ